MDRSRQGKRRKLKLSHIERTRFASPPAFQSGSVRTLRPGLFFQSVSRLQEHMRRAYVANRPDGPRSFACVAWACRGIVPQ
jgi:hypothetical protein